MLDPRDLAERRDEIAESCRDRRMDADVDAAVAAHQRVNALRTEQNDANRRRNEHQKAGKAKLSEAEREAHNAEGRRIKEEIAALDERLRAAEAELHEQLERLPNYIHPETPRGGEEDFREVSRWGELPEPDFEPRDHLALCEALDLVDFESGAKVAGQKWYFLKNELVLLEMALSRYAMDVAIDEGFTPIATPDVARPDIVSGAGYNPRGEETQIYSIANADLCLVGTAEITLGGMLADTILREEELPLRLAGLSHCFRTEAGAAGRESKGLYRVHQFTKVELFAFTRPEDSEAAHADLLRIEERIFQGLELPYRVIDIASGDLGAPAYRKYDLEAWMSGRGEWGEVTSTSNCTDYQARRLKVRFRRRGEKKKPELVHMLNGTAVSNARCMVALLEAHQRSDGSVGVPKALQPYLGFDAIGPRDS